MTSKQIVRVLNGNVNSFLRIIFIALLLGLFSFLFYQTVSAPSVFATKEEVKTIQDNIGSRLDRIESKVDDINRFLRDR